VGGVECEGERQGEWVVLNVRANGRGSGWCGEKGRDLLRERDRRREQAAAPAASTIGFSSQVRRWREGKDEQKDRLVKRLQLQRRVGCCVDEIKKARGFL
jgi:hypothetical protein